MPTGQRCRNGDDAAYSCHAGHRCAKAPFRERSPARPKGIFRRHACLQKDPGGCTMILWCTKCREFRKKNTPDWHECRYSSRHMMVPGHERMEKEMRQVRERISSSGKPRDEDLKRLGALEAVKNAESDEDDERGHVAAVTNGMIAGHAYMEHGSDGAFFWVKGGGSWDLFRHDDAMVADLIQAEYFRKYGVVVQNYYMTPTLAAHRLRAKLDGLRVDRVWRRAGFDGHTLWVDLGGRPRRLYGISAKKHGPAVLYSPDVRVVIERHGNIMPDPSGAARGGWRRSAPCCACGNHSAPSSARTSATCSACTTRPRRCCSPARPAPARLRPPASRGSWRIPSGWSMPPRCCQSRQRICARSWQDRLWYRLTTCGG